jgi:hypothetical protein
MTERDTLIAYLRMKVEQADWHGVRDAAVDIEILEARERGQQDVYRLQRDETGNA